MLDFKHTIKSVIEVDYYEIDRIISKAYSVEYELAQVEELMNDVTKSISVDGRYIDDYVIKELEAGKVPMYSLSNALNDMFNKGLIPKGTYMINISW